MSASGKRGPILLLAAVGAIVPLVGVALMLVLGGGDCGGGGVEGEIRSTGEPYGDYVMRPSSCYSGEHESFFGVWVAPALSEDESGRTGFKGGLKLVKSHDGRWLVFVESPNECRGFDCVIRELDPEHCNTFSIDVRNTNSRVNRIVVREGRADLQCQLPEGGTFAAHLVFGGCS